MLTMTSQVSVPGLTGLEVTDFLLNCSDAGYQRWWPGTHLHLLPRAAGDVDHVGDAVFMDELIGSRRLRMTAVVVHADAGRKIAWQMTKGIRLPAWLTIEVENRGGGVVITHTITAGWNGPGRILDPILRLYFSADFAAAMDKHVHTEFPLMRDRVHPVVD